jgi:hypothetical protein
MIRAVTDGVYVSGKKGTLWVFKANFQPEQQKAAGEHYLDEELQPHVARGEAVRLDRDQVERLFKALVSRTFA